jgi:uncharacterized membrane protein YagU involved in acid resistance
LYGIFWGGLVAGLLDATDGVIAFGIKGMNPIQVLQYIASGALGDAAFKGGLVTAVFGLGFHFLIAFTVAAIYYGASRKIPGLTQSPVLWGLAYGVAVYLVMTYGVLPLSAIAKSPFSLPLFLNGIIGHAVFVGLPIAFYSRRASR